MNLKVHHHKYDVFPLIKGVLLMLPLFFVLFTSLYVTFNQNAKDSYYGETINQSSYKYVDDNNFSVETTYYLSNSNINSSYSGLFLYVDNFVVVERGTITDTDYNLITESVDSLKRIRFSGSVINLDRYVDGEYVFITDIGYNIRTFVLSFNILSRNTDEITINNLVYSIEYNNYSFLNNALPYAMSEFNDIGFGKIDFVSLIGDFFIDVGQFNNVYLKFINTYINYFLFVELVLFVPSVLHFVIHWFENLGKDISSGKEKD